MLITILTEIHAPAARCFDLARDIDLHIRSFRHTDERAVAGVTSGLIGLGEEVTWEGTHFGVRQRLTSRITAFSSPHHFRDEMLRGAFKTFVHDHYFEEIPNATLMRDEVRFESPLGVLGRLVDTAFMGGYVSRLIAGRAAVIREAAEQPQG